MREAPSSPGNSRAVRITGRGSENFDNPASRDFPVVALLDHPGELGPKPEQTADPALDGLELIGSDLADLFAGRLWHVLETKHRFDSRDIETEVSRVPDERQPPNVLGAVESSSTFRAGGGGMSRIRS